MIATASDTDLIASRIEFNKVKAKSISNLNEKKSFNQIYKALMSRTPNCLDELIETCMKQAPATWI